MSSIARALLAEMVFDSTAAGVAASSTTVIQNVCTVCGQQWFPGTSHERQIRILSGQFGAEAQAEELQRIRAESEARERSRRSNATGLLTGLVIILVVVVVANSTGGPARAPARDSVVAGVPARAPAPGAPRSKGARANPLPSTQADRVASEQRKYGTTKWAGDPDTKTYFVNEPYNCEALAAVPEEHRTYFITAAEAARAGYRLSMDAACQKPKAPSERSGYDQWVDPNASPAVTRDSSQ
jgi:hypothetical protein